MTERGAEARNASGAETGKEKRAEAGKGSGAEAKNADAAVLEVETADSEAATEVPILVQNSTVPSEGRLVCLTASN